MVRLSKTQFNLWISDLFIAQDKYVSGLTMHSHEFLEIVYINSGQAVHCINDREYEAKIGNIYIVDFGDSHTFYNRSNDFTIINICFVPEFVDNSLAGCSSMVDVFAYLVSEIVGEKRKMICSPILFDWNSDLSILISEMLIEYRRHELARDVILKSLFYAFMVKLIRLNERRNDTPRIQHMRVLVHRIIRFLENNYREHVKLDDVARKINLSPGYICEIFKQITGISIIDYLHNIRIREACNMLRYKNMSVSATMREVGYSDPKFFYDIFKRQTGMTPGMYRNNRS